MTEYNGHGGRCCGISHAWGIGTSPYASNRCYGVAGNSRECLERVIQNHHGTNASRVLEVVTAEDEEDEEILQTSAWEDTLVELGFHKVSSFINSNSGNRCTVWHKHPNLTLYGNERQPGHVRVQEIEVPGPPVREERRVILTEYFPNFRASGRGRPFSAVEEVRAAHPLVRTIERRDVYNDGSIEWSQV